jgi:hypothetical protein
LESASGCIKQKCGDADLWKKYLDSQHCLLLPGYSSGIFHVAPALLFANIYKYLLSLGEVVQIRSGPLLSCFPDPFKQFTDSDPANS